MSGVCVDTTQHTKWVARSERAYFPRVDRSREGVIWTLESERLEKGRKRQGETQRDRDERVASEESR